MTEAILKAPTELKRRISVAALGFGVTAVVIALSYLWQLWVMEEVNHFGISILVLATITRRLQWKWPSLRFDPSLPAVGAGLILLGTSVIPVLWPSATAWTCLAPAALILGLCLTFFGFRQLPYFRVELGIVAFFGLITLGVGSLLEAGGVESVVPFLSPVSPTYLTAQVASLYLEVLGYSVALEGTTLALPTAKLEVNYECSGLNGFGYLLVVSVLFLALHPESRRRLWYLPLLAIAIGFAVNTVRIALLTVALGEDPGYFDSLHNGPAARLFGGASISLFVAVAVSLVYFRSGQLRRILSLLRR